ncbi:tetratricopeptide repeat protein [Pseudidiomarina sp.]|uniref:tetratricopeptide repeat protein n=1 Tax=Pseudidiomarina sp. TaxID=2081707 RepID=UPI003A969C9D
MKRSIITTLCALSLLGTVQAQDTFDSELLQLQHDWANANYQQQDDAQEQAFDDLAVAANEFVTRYPERAEAHIWKGIILSTQAGVEGGLGALGLAKDSRAELELALTIDPTALDGSAYTSLGTLYYKVPGWPISFGDDDLARENLEKALALNPHGIDPNFFYGEFLYEEGEYARAVEHLNKALNAPARPTRPLADSERRKEVEQLLAKVNKKLKKRRS